MMPKPSYFRFMVTPVRKPANLSQRNYNRSHIRTRCVVKRTIGILKRLFGCLSTKLHYAPEKVGEIVVACAILHNLCIYYGHQLQVELNDIEPMDDNEQMPAENLTGLAFRNAFIEQYFNN